MSMKNPVIGIHLKFVYFVKVLSKDSANLCLENLENTSSFENWGLTLVAYKKESVIFASTFLHVEVYCGDRAFITIP